MPRKATPLTAVQIRQARPDQFPLWDGEGLHLICTPAGEKLWRLKYYRPDGRENRLALGNLREVSLADARQARITARAMLREGLDPGGERRRAREQAKRQVEAEFPLAAAAWLAKKKPHWAPETYRKAQYVVDTYLIPPLRRASVATLDSRDGNRAIDQIVDKSPSLARKARQYLSGIIDEAIHAGLREDGRRLVLRRSVSGSKDKGHIPAATVVKEVETLVAAIARYDSPVIRAALTLAMLTAMRPGIVAGARWDEIDLKAGEWTVAADRMKTRHVHIVPLPRQALKVLAQMAELTAGRTYVFPAIARQKSPHLNRDSLSAALRRMGFQGRHATHGFRGMLRTVGRERLGIDSDVLEAQLAHAKSGEVQRAYDRTTFDDARRKAMQDWADYLDGLLAASASDVSLGAVR